MRSGILSVDHGQMEAGRSLGLNYVQTMFRIVFPQAIKNILPTLGNEFITLIKETSVVSLVGATDLFCAFQYIGNNNYEYMIPYLMMALIYIIVIVLLTLLIKFIERRLRASDKR
jgi:polar amino acid transport system permease protein